MKTTSFARTFLILLLLATVPLAHGREILSEASGVCRSDGSLVIAGDEETDTLWLVDDDQRQKVRTVKVAGGDWDDMEDLSAVDANRFFALTSHSRTKKGKRRPEREQLMLIAKKGSRFSVAHTWSLRKQILATLEKSVGQIVDMDNAEAAPPEEGGLNLEGILYLEGNVYLGLRSPLTKRGDAIVLKIENGNGLLNGDAPVFGAVTTVPLNGNGIRGMSSHSKGVAMIAGPSDDSLRGFALYQWAPGAKKAAELKLPGFETLSRPEGVAAEKDGTFVFVQDFEEASQQDVIVKLPRK